MIKQKIPTLLLLAFSCSVGAQKLYQFEDQHGRWSFSDQQPVVETTMIVKQLAVQAERKVKLLQSGNNPIELAVFNGFSRAVQVEIKLTGIKNCRILPALPANFIAQPGESKPVVYIYPGSQGLQSPFLATYRYVLGAPVPNYASSYEYLPPIAQGAKFPITQGFDGEFSHTEEPNRLAVDISMPVGTPVYAARDGVVMSVDDGYYKSGLTEQLKTKANSIRIFHNDGSMAVYAHLAPEKAQVISGQKVKVGQLIGYSGNTGFSSGPHLHFAVQINQGMKLVSVPFKWRTSEGAKILNEGDWLTGIGLDSN